MESYLDTENLHTEIVYDYRVVYRNEDIFVVMYFATFRLIFIRTKSVD